MSRQTRNGAGAFTVPPRSAARKEETVNVPLPALEWLRAHDQCWLRGGPRG